MEFSKLRLQLGLFADTQIGVSNTNTASVYVLFKKLDCRLISFIYDSMVSYSESYIFSFRPELTRDEILEIKEQIDDYLEDVQYRVGNRLDSFDQAKLSRLSNESIADIINRVNTNNVQITIKNLIENYERIEQNF